MIRPLVLTGPTGAGKSDVALAIAERYGAHLVSMDAMQVYRGMDIGTAKLSPKIRARFPHACIDVRDPDEEFTARDFVDEAERAGTPTILVGGTTFYLRAWLFGLVETPAVDPSLRASLEALSDPHAALAEVDPVLAARLHRNDRVRIVRGLEVHALTGRRLSEMHDADPKHRRDAEVVWLDTDELYDRIDARVDRMMAEGYLAEVEGLLARGYPRELKPMRSLGYRHLATYLAGEVDLAEAIRLTKRDTRHYARKQRGFLRSWKIPRTDPFEAARRAFGE